MMAVMSRQLLRTTTAEKLGPQLFVGQARPIPELFSAPTQEHRCGGIKPVGGLWTSSLLPDGTSDWIRWCRDESFGDVDDLRWWSLDPAPEARILEIDTLQDLVRLDRRFGAPSYPEPDLARFRKLDFQAMAEEFDALHLTEEGQWRTRLSMPLSLYGWDCESTVWLRWAFDSESVELPHRETTNARP